MTKIQPGYFWSCMIYLDFESRSRVDIWEVGAWAYSVHPSTEILCLAYCEDEGTIWLAKDFKTGDSDIGNVRDFFEYYVKHSQTFHAYNAFFEQCMWQNILVKKYGWPRIPIKQWRCVMAKSLAYAHPQSLDNCAQALQSTYQKNRAGHTLMLKMCKPNSQ